jgi:predicted nucleic acid-binding Zn ribbon protein
MERVKARMQALIPDRTDPRVCSYCRCAIVEDGQDYCSDACEEQSAAETYAENDMDQRMLDGDYAEWFVGEGR